MHNLNYVLIIWANLLNVIELTSKPGLTIQAVTLLMRTIIDASIPIGKIMLRETSQHTLVMVLQINFGTLRRGVTFIIF